MVQRIGGKDPSSETSSSQGPKRQDERASSERASKFKSMLGTGKGSEGSQGADAARRGPGGDLDPAGAGKAAAGNMTKMDEVAKDMQAALQQLGVKTQRANEESDKVSNDAATASQLAANTTPSWERPEGPARLEGPARMSPMELEGMERMHKLMVGQGPTGAEARLAITDGPMAGAQIHLKTGPGGIEATVSTTNNSSRQTLVNAMDEVARRMKDRGHKLSVEMKPPPQPGRWQNQERGSGPF
jgi:hypothetical protein